MPDQSAEKGTTTATRSAGLGPVLLCLHGIGSSSRSFAAQIDGLADIARVVAWDAPGYGASAAWSSARGMDGYADAAAALLDQLGVDTADVLGTSFGGVIATRLALIHPERVRSLVLADATPGSGVDPERAAVMRARPDELARDGAVAFAAARATRLLSPDAGDDLIDLVADTMADAIGLPGYAHAAEAMAATDHRDRFAAISAPTLVLVGEHDRVTPPEMSRAIAQAVPGASYAEVPAAGHVSNVENPGAFNDLVREFLDEVHARTPSRTPAPSAGASRP